MKRSPLIDSAIEILRQGETLLLRLDDEKYTRRLPAVFTSAIGGHYRHCLDHFDCLLSGVAAGEVDYDHRRRDPRIENDRAFAYLDSAYMEHDVRLSFLRADPKWSVLRSDARFEEMLRRIGL